MKKYYELFKKNWDDPNKRVFVKFGLWIVFFVFVYTLIIIGGNKDIKLSVETNENNYNTILEHFSSNPYTIKYKVNNYTIEGTIINSIFNGTLEFDNTLIRIKYDNQNLYTITNGEEIVNNELLNEINKDYLIPGNIIRLIIPYEPIINNNLYSYNINDKALTIKIIDSDIKSINILDSTITYELEYNLIA